MADYFELGKKIASWDVRAWAFELSRGLGLGLRAGSSLDYRTFVLWTVSPLALALLAWGYRRFQRGVRGSLGVAVVGGATMFAVAMWGIPAVADDARTVLASVMPSLSIDDELMAALVTAMVDAR